MSTCECELAGYCKRHNIIKDEGTYQLCKTSQQAFMLMEKEAGIIDEQSYHRMQAANKPSTVKQLWNLTKDTVVHVGDGLAGVDNEELDRRIKICESCPLFIASERRCSLCGCYMDIKASWRSGHCPDKPARW